MTIRKTKNSNGASLINAPAAARVLSLTVIAFSLAACTTIFSGDKVDYKGTKILMCCGKCEKAWNAASDASKAYWVKAATEEGVLPQFKGKEKELGLDTIKLMDQKYSAVSYKTIVTPESPTVEYKGKKYFVFNAKEQEKWAKDPDGSYEKAVAAGVIK